MHDARLFSINPCFFLTTCIKTSVSIVSAHEFCISLEPVLGIVPKNASVTEPIPAHVITYICIIFTSPIVLICMKDQSATSLYHNWVKRRRHKNHWKLLPSFFFSKEINLLLSCTLTFNPLTELLVPYTYRTQTLSSHSLVSRFFFITQQCKAISMHSADQKIRIFFS